MSVPSDMLSLEFPEFLIKSLAFRSCFEIPGTFWTIGKRPYLFLHGTTFFFFHVVTLALILIVVLMFRRAL